jgi:hypothetical protein
MPWTIDLRTPQEPELLNEFLLVLGKALALANNFESKCTHYLRVIAISNATKEGASLDDIAQIALQFRPEMLASTLKKILQSDSISQSIRDVLNRARESRNFIAHQGGSVGDLYGVNAKAFTNGISVLREHVENVAHGDNIVSRWAYEVSERLPAPRSMADGYVPLVMAWVFDP